MSEGPPPGRGRSNAFSQKGQQEAERQAQELEEARRLRQEKRRAVRLDAPPLPQDMDAPDYPAPPNPQQVMEKFIADIQRVSGVAQNEAGVRRVESITESLEDVMGDADLHPLARRIAGQFNRYIPQTRTFENSGEPERDIGNGEKLARRGKMAVIDGQGKILARPGGNDDMRNIGILAGVFSDVFTDKETNSTGKPISNNGNSIVGSLSKGSEMSKEVATHMLTLSKDLQRGQRDKLRNWIQAGQKNLGNGAEEKAAAKQAQKLITPGRALDMGLGDR